MTNEIDHMKNMVTKNVAQYDPRVHLKVLSKDKISVGLASFHEENSRSGMETRLHYLKYTNVQTTEVL